MLTIGSRGSALALAQSGRVRDEILARYPDAEVTIKIIKTSADRDTTTSIRSGSATGVFVKEIEEALLAGEIDLAVHSMKDLPTRIPESLAISAIPPREDVRDALISRKESNGIAGLPQGSVVGTGSARRQSQILALRPDLSVLDIRGNVDTRLQKLADGSYDAIILACAGLNRLGLQDHISARISLDEMLPAPGQGALALETRKNDSKVLPVISFLHDPSAAVAVLAERAFLRRMGGGCNSPVAVHGKLEEKLVRIEGMVASLDGKILIRDSATAAPEAAEETATLLADKILKEGGAAILDSIP